MAPIIQRAQNDKKASMILEPLTMYSYFIHHIGNKKEL